MDQEGLITQLGQKWHHPSHSVSGSSQANTRGKAFRPSFALAMSGSGPKALQTTLRVLSIYRVLGSGGLTGLLWAVVVMTQDGRSSRIRLPTTALRIGKKKQYT